MEACKLTYRQYCGKDSHIVVYPISAGRIINVVAFMSKVENEGKALNDLEIRDATREEVLEHFSGWEEEVMQLLSVSGAEILSESRLIYYQEHRKTHSLGNPRSIPNEDVRFSQDSSSWRCR